MQFITGLFGGGGNTILTMIFALGIVLALIVLAVWLLKLVSNFSGNAVRGRNKRLSVVDTLALDQKRQLIIVRRDNTEHLILVGGPQDVVVETGIAVEEAPVATQPARRPIPTLGKNRPAETKPAEQISEPNKAASAPTAAPGTLLEQLQKAGHPADRKARVSLRQTGLLRPVTEQDPTLSVQNPDSSGGRSNDSAKEVKYETASEGPTLEHQDGEQPNRT